ncbi:MAG: hypothetical protein H0V76_10435 [Blastocatellia bacterium]|nr:hypothetical protein [Blastocatellia bacterium]
MMTKLYFALWAVLTVIAGGIALTGNLTEMALVISGFFAFGMTFMGMMSVLPTAVHDSLVKH